MFESLERRELLTADVFSGTSGTFVGEFNFPDRSAEWYYDVFPEGYAENGKVTIAWLGEQSKNDHDPSVIGDVAHDRIYQSETLRADTGQGLTLNGWFTQWDGSPMPNYGGLAGSTGEFETDDHLVASPSTIKIGNQYVRFIETYGNWITKINRFFSFERGDNWVTHGTIGADNLLGDQLPGYNLEPDKTEELGFALRYARAGSHPIYSGELTLPDGKKNRFLSIHPIQPGTDKYGYTTTALNGGHPVFHLFDSPGTNPRDRKPIYNFFDPQSSNTYATADPDGEDTPGAVADNNQAGWNGVPGLLGYAITDLKHSQDSLGALQNRIRMLVSDDGRNWEPVDGAATDGAMIAPMFERTASWRKPVAATPQHDEISLAKQDPLRYDAFRSYGSGFPMALIRDGHLELYFTDTTEQFPRRGEFQEIHPIMWRIRIPISEAFDPLAYVTAKRERTLIYDPAVKQVFLNGPGAGFGYNDIKWSPVHQRYFAYLSVNGQPAIHVSEQNPPADRPPRFHPDDVIMVEIPGHLKAGAGAIVGDLNGHTLDCGNNVSTHGNLAESTCQALPHTALHIIHEVYPADAPPAAHHLSNLAHSLVLGYFDPATLPDPPSNPAPSGPTPYYASFGSDSTVVIEAEDFDDQLREGDHYWTIVTHLDAAQGNAMRALPNEKRGFGSFNTAGNARLDYDVLIQESGWYNVWVRGMGQSGNDDSVHVGLDGMAVSDSDKIAVRGDGRFAWSNKTHDGTPAKMYVEAGLHTISLKIREDGVFVDRLLLTLDGDYRPTGTELPVSPRAPLVEKHGIVIIEAENADYRTARDNRTWVDVPAADAAFGFASQVSDENQNAPRRQEYLVRFSSPGRYYVWVRGKGLNGTSDSVHVTLDGKRSSSSSAIELGGNNKFNWYHERMSRYGGGAAYIDVDTPGLHTVGIMEREDGAIIDRLIFVKDPAFQTSGLGPPESPREVDPIDLPIVLEAIAEDLAPEAMTSDISIVTGQEGFVARFNHDVDTSALNLYDQQRQPAPPDVTLVGDSVGPVNGSLVVDQDARQVTFIKTGAMLQADTYTVTLRSDEDGFRDTNGNPLDGDGDGTAGGDFIFTFSVAADTAPVLSLPDFTRGPRQDVAVPATEAGIPLSLSGAAGVLSVDFRLEYDPDLLDVAAVSVSDELLALGWSAEFNLPTPGDMTVSLHGTSPLNDDDVQLGRIQASVPADAAYGGSTILSLANALLNQGAIPVKADSAVQTVAYFGDTTGNGTYSGLDATYVARVAAGLDSGFSAFPLCDPHIVGDVTGNGSFSGFDAAYVAQKAAGLPVDHVPDLPGDPSSLVVEPPGEESQAAAPNQGIPIDMDASVDGSFVDTTPGGDTDFITSRATDDLTALPGAPSAGTADLLATVFHEFGQVPGVQHDVDVDTDETLPLGTRRLGDDAPSLCGDSPHADRQAIDSDLDPALIDEFFATSELS